MSPRDLMCNIKTQTQALTIALHRAAIKRLEQTIQRGLRNRLAGVGDREFKPSRATDRLYANRLIRRSIRKRIAQQIGGS